MNRRIQQAAIAPGEFLPKQLNRTRLAALCFDFDLTANTGSNRGFAIQYFYGGICFTHRIASPVHDGPSSMRVTAAIGLQPQETETQTGVFFVTLQLPDIVLEDNWIVQLLTTGITDPGDVLGLVSMIWEDLR